MSRFDISQASQFESRDGGITKGGLVRNGFSEVDGAGERWACMRPALATGGLSTFTGGLGLFLIGTTLYGMGNNGTANSWLVTFGTNTTTQVNFVLDAQDAGGATYEFRFGVDGALTPDLWKSKQVDVLGAQAFGGTGNFFLEVQGTLAQNFYGTVSLNGSPYVTSTATFTQAGGITSWRWNTTPISTTGTYNGFFTG